VRINSVVDIRNDGAIEPTERPMPGILKIAYKLLINDRTKFAALLMGTAP
jgi:hypothetical protein